MDRLEEIREALRAKRKVGVYGCGWETTAALDHMPWLLERIGELERENEKMREEVKLAEAHLRRLVDPHYSPTS